MKLYTKTQTQEHTYTYTRTMPPMIEDFSGSLSEILVHHCCTLKEEFDDGMAIVFIPVLLACFIICKMSDEKSGVYYRSEGPNGWGH